MSTALNSVAPPVSREDYVVGVVLSHDFRMHSDGWCYPMGGKPLVRICIHRGKYVIERRRSPQTVWMRIVTQNVAEFDQVAFESWRNSWPLTA